jgi:hypothetical protein
MEASCRSGRRAEDHGGEGRAFGRGVEVRLEEGIWIPEREMQRSWRAIDECMIGGRCG